MEQLSVIGLDIGGSKTAVVEGTHSGEILQRHEIPTEAERPFRETFPALTDLVDGVRKESHARGWRPAALSVSIGGPLRIEAGVLIDPPHLPGWHHLDLKRALRRRYPNLPVFVEHDGNAGALAEFYFGAGKDRVDLLHLIFLTFGTGMGAGVIANGQVVHGATDTAGEVGHWRLADDGPIGFGKAGSFEGFASGTGLVKLASRRFPDRWSPNTPVRILVDEMLASDPDALDIAEEAGTWLGRGLALLVDVLNPQMIVLGSLAVALGELVLAPARRELRREALAQAVEACEVVPSALGKRIGDVAALMPALTRSDLFPLPSR